MHSFGVCTTALFTNRDFSLRKVGKFLQRTIFVGPAVKNPDGLITDAAHCLQVVGICRVNEATLQESNFDRTIRIKQQIRIFLGPFCWHQRQFDPAFGKEVFVALAILAISPAVSTCGDRHGFWWWRVGDEDDCNQRAKNNDDDQKNGPGQPRVIEYTFHGVHINWLGLRCLSACLKRMIIKRDLDR